MVAPDGLARSCAVQFLPSGEVQIAWQLFSEPAATKPVPTGTAAAAKEPAPPLVSPFTQFFRSADHHRATRAWPLLPSLPTTRYPPGPAATPRNCAPLPARSVRAGWGVHVTPSGDQKSTGPAVPFSFIDPTAIQPDGPSATEVSCPVRPASAAADTRDQVPSVACRQTAGWASA